MQIGTNYNSYQTINSQVSANKSESNAKAEETQTFSSLMDSEKVEEKSEILEYLDKYKAFDSLNEEDAKLFRELLSDGSLDDEDMKKLSFEQTKTMHGIVLRDWSGNMDLPIIGVLKGKSFDLLASATYTGDDKFNKVLYKTMNETEDSRVRSNYFSMLWLNLSQLASGKEALPGFQEGANIGNFAGFGPHNKDDVNINFEEFLYNYTARLQQDMNSTRDNIDIFKQYKRVNDFYTKVLNNYVNYSE
ncbi:hypothetical protein ACH5BK_05125 [Arcobacter sp. YIC-80]|uniref:hypothetical protein n=1 Tax=Arcobacter sp. YIC-80 TaxID=3376683 RepID=UPI0038514C4C